MQHEFRVGDRVVLRPSAPMDTLPECLSAYGQTEAGTVEYVGRTKCWVRWRNGATVKAVIEPEYLQLVVEPNDERRLPLDECMTMIATIVAAEYKMDIDKLRCGVDSAYARSVSAYLMYLLLPVSQQTIADWFHRKGRYWTISAIHRVRDEHRTHRQEDQRFQELRKLIQGNLTKQP